MTDDDLADALSSDFASSASPPAGEKDDMPKEVLVLLYFKNYCLPLKRDQIYF